MVGDMGMNFPQVSMSNKSGRSSSLESCCARLPSRRINSRGLLLKCSIGEKKGLAWLLKTVKVANILVSAHLKTRDRIRWKLFVRGWCPQVFLQQFKLFKSFVLWAQNFNKYKNHRFVLFLKILSDVSFFADNCRNRRNSDEAVQ